MARGQSHETRWVEAKTTGYAIPAFGLCQITGATWEAPGRTVLTVDRPGENNCQPLAINSFKPIAAGDYGLVACEGPIFVLYDDGDTPAAGELWGPAADSFEATEGMLGLIVLGGIDTTKGIVCVNFATGQQWMIGKISGGAIAAEATGTVTRYDQMWVITNPAETYTVVNPHQVELPNGLRVRWTKYPGWTNWVVEIFDYTEC